MYQFSYAEVLEEAPQGAREREYEALDRSVQLLKAAEKAGAQSRECVEAVLYVRRLWNLFLEDLASSENDLPKELRAELISIGLWIMKEIEQIRLEKSTNFKSLIEVSENIRDGLK
jgi:flagellar biosynthesis activator protein FlaF